MLPFVGPNDVRPEARLIRSGRPPQAFCGDDYEPSELKKTPFLSFPNSAKPLDDVPIGADT